MAIRLTIEGARVLAPDGWTDALHLADGAVVDAAQPRRVRLDGWLVLPGIVDLHGDGFERHVAKRRGALKDYTSGLQSIEAELAANGITTAYLAQFYSWEGGLRGPEAAERLCAGLREYRTQGTDMRVQLRVESHMIDAFPDILALVERFGVPYVVINDHLPHDALEAGKRPPRINGQALRAGTDPERYLQRMKDLHARRDEVPDAVSCLVEQLHARQVRTGSHDDADAAARRAARALGLRVSEFPETMDAAQEARGAGEGTILGAPNVMRGGSHAGKVAAEEVIAAGFCDALASDYYYPAPRHAALRLAGQGMVLDEAWRLVSEGPARLLGLPDRGRLAPGCRADVVILDPADGSVGATLCAGRVTYMAGPVAEALIAA
ncbi:alpha-D-ribose 1-methylphosphonate 5-triphosphate diphosphatase [Pseudaestuariivita atlantica]|uniref:Phosphonate metabolism protein PhnM n=1 Tax=Pseudaestuariivita atlantica TaxID=1317121 RepID=A0A0L1JT94_9RHOB|nr:alpha-D-ribose 1-methylphosphonate 5-triphosphate diphosphatase [Pseudaestuariivita atlantica]KNG94984.1 phosphonate metabolism protein PhnM [Pseudaestuariivita atlantica]